MFGRTPGRHHRSGRPCQHNAVYGVFMCGVRMAQINRKGTRLRMQCFGSMPVSCSKLTVAVGGKLKPNRQSVRLCCAVTAVGDEDLSVFAHTVQLLVVVERQRNMPIGDPRHDITRAQHMKGRHAGA